MLALPNELEMPPLSVFTVVDHNELGNIPGESGTIGATAAEVEVWKLLRDGMVMPPRTPTTGDDSGDGCSARVE